jgi:hypothetical protein
LVSLMASRRAFGLNVGAALIRQPDPAHRGITSFLLAKNTGNLADTTVRKLTSRTDLRIFSLSLVPHDA